MRSRYQLYSDSELAELTIQQDDHAFKELYDRYWPHMYAFAFKLLKNEDDAKDLLQDTFTSLYKRIASITIESTVRSYLYTSIRNGVLDRVKHEKIKTNYISQIRDYYEHREKHGDLSTDNQVRFNELAQLIEKQIENLPPKMRAIFELSRKQYLTHKEIAQQLGISEQTVKKTITTAIIRLKSKLSVHFWLHLMTSILWLNKHL